MNPKTNGDLPPHSLETERAALACVFGAAVTGSQAEVEACLLKLKPNYFYDLRHRSLFEELVKMRLAGHAVDLVTSFTWVKHHQKEGAVGGTNYLNEIATSDAVYVIFPDHVETLRKLAVRRWALAESARLTDRAKSGDLDLHQLRGELTSALDTLDRATTQNRPQIEVVTVKEIQAYVPDQKTFLIGADMLCLGEFSVIAGLPEAGKTMLANTLAVAGARGEGTWMGYDIRRKFRTFVLQSEGSMRRMQKELARAADGASEWIRFTKPCNMAFGDSSFRKELRRIWEDWPFDLLVVDNWSDCVQDDKFADYQTGLDSIRASLPGGDQLPAILIVAHLSKAVIKAERPLTGRALMAHVSGSFRIGQKARTVFTLVRAHPELNDCDKVIFDCAKANNDNPLPMSAWHRQPLEFLPCSDFDFNGWLNPEPEADRRVITAEVMAELFAGGRRALKRNLVEDLMGRGFSQPNAYRALDLEKGRFKDYLQDVGGLLAWRGEAK